MAERNTHGLMTEKEAATYLSCKPHRLKYLREIDLLPHQKIGKYMIVYGKEELNIARHLLSKDNALKEEN